MDAVHDSLGEGVRDAGLDDLLRAVLDRVGQIVDDQERLKLLLDAVVAIAADLSLDSVLNRIVRTASELAGAEFAALGVLGSGTERRLEAFVTHGLSDTEREKIGDLPSGHGILGLIIDRPEPLRLPDLSTHAASYGFPGDHPPMNSFLGVPIRIREKVFGNLYLTEKRGGGDFTEQDETIVVALAAAAGVVIENARLYAEAARRERWLAATAEITALLLGQASQNQALQAIADRACEISGADVSSVSLTLDDAMEVQVVSGPIADPRRVGQGFPLRGSIAGTVVESGEPVVVEDLSRDPRARLTSWGSASGKIGPTVIVPLRTGEGVVGVLSLAWQPDHRADFQALDIELPQRFAEQAALALEVARARRDHEKLVLFEDRDRIGRDLHDLVIQRLFAIGLGLQNTGRMAGDAEFEERVAQAVDDIDATIKDIRRTIYALNTAPESTEVRTQLADVVSRASDSLGFAPRLQMNGPIDSVVTDEVAIHLVAVLGEALSNAARHSKATEVMVKVEVDETVLLIVEDNGIGLPDEPSRVGGLQNMRERAERLMGSCEVSGSPQGTTVVWEVPCQGGTQ